MHEPQRAGAVLLLENLGTGDVGRHQVGGELNPLEAEIEDLGERLDEERLREAGDAGDQAVAAGKERDEHLIDDLVLADDDAAQLREDAFAPVLHALGDIGNGGRNRGHVVYARRADERTGR